MSEERPTFPIIPRAMRYIDPEDVIRRKLLHDEGVLIDQGLSGATDTGSMAGFLIEELCENPALVDTAAWIAFGIRNGMARLPGTVGSEGHAASLKLNSQTIERILTSWMFPIDANMFGQRIIACPPGWPKIDPLSGATPEDKSPIYCVATLEELADLKKIFTGLN